MIRVSCETKFQKGPKCKILIQREVSFMIIFIVQGIYLFIYLFYLSSVLASQMLGLPCYYSTKYIGPKLFSLDDKGEGEVRTKYVANRPPLCGNIKRLVLEADGL